MIAERRVRHLGIRAADAGQARRARLLIEDALRTASLPGDGGELLLVRRLRLPAFTARASPQQVAMGIESAWRGTAVVTGADSDDERLAAAAAVRFADTLEAHQALTAHLLQGRPPRAWCWPLAVPGYRADEGASAGLRRVALSLGARAEAPAALACWWDQLLAAGAAARVLLTLGEDEAALLTARVDRQRRGTPDPASAHGGQQLLQWVRSHVPPTDARRRLAEALTPALRNTPEIAHGASTASSRGTDGEPAPSAEREPSADAGVSARGETRPGPPLEQATRPPATAAPLGRTPPADEPAAPHRESARLATAAAEDVQPSAAHAAGDGRGHQRTRPPQASPPQAASGPGPAAQDDDNENKNDSETARRRHRPGSSDASTSARTAADAPGGDVQIRGEHTSGRGVPPPPQAAASPLVPPAAQALAAPTRAGGLLFLLPVLEHLGLPAWLEVHPQHTAALPGQILGLLLQRLRLPADDPAWRLGTPAAGEARRTAATWLAACRRHLRLQLGIGPASLCLRPAQLELTPTHADLWLAMDQLDLRVRRAGLDLDPGWVPWFGRVVCFHYGARPR